MPTYLTETLHRFCTQEMFSHWQQNKPTYQWIAANWVEFDDDTEVIGKKTFRALVWYLKKRDKCPPSVEALIEYIRSDPDKIHDFEKSQEPEEELRNLVDYE